MEKSADNVVGLDGKPVVEPKTEAEIAQAVIAELATRRARGEVIDIIDYIRLDHNREIEKFLVASKICTQREWNALTKSVRISDALGGVPETSLNFVELVAAKERVSYSFSGMLKRDGPPMFVGDAERPPTLIDEEMRKDALWDDYARIMHEASMNEDEFELLLRSYNDDHAVGFNEREIRDALTRWLMLRRREALLVLQRRIAYRPGPHTGPQGQEVWRQLVRRVFVLNEDTPDEFVVAAVKKFFWQVKRKILGLPVTRHLMVVFVGLTGAGKSTFMLRLLEPVSELAKDTDFEAICEKSNIDLWRFFVLYLDEMAHATKTDIDITKHVISADKVSRRPFYTNRVVTVPQCATFTGCCNKELNQLIRDETSARRFVGLRFQNAPDWDFINALNVIDLWASVDERGVDPMLPHLAALGAVQEAQREQSTVELWARQARLAIGWHLACDMYDDFQVWEKANEEKMATGLRAFAKELVRLANAFPDMPFERAEQHGRKTHTENGSEWYWRGKLT